jgi:hypothetical protein
MGVAPTVCDRCRGSLGGRDAAEVAGRKHNGGIAPEEGCRIAERALGALARVADRDGPNRRGSVTFYTFTTYMQKYLVNTAGMQAQSASLVMAAVLVVFMLVQPAFGALSDKIGRRASLRCFGVLSVLLTVPLLNALGTVSSPSLAFVLVMCALLITSLVSTLAG